MLLLSARTAEALQQSRSALAAELSGPDEAALPDVAYTLERRRKETIRMAAVVADRADAATVLTAEEHDNVFVGESVPSADNSDRVVFLFPGQGAQHIGMARGLYESEPVFAEHFDQCAAGFGEELGIDLRAEVFDGTARNLERTDRTQPALFAVEYALAKLIESYGVRPAALAGHSIGEYVAGHHRGRLRPCDRHQGGVDAGTADARRAPWGHGRGGAGSRCHRRIPFRRTSTSPR